MGRDFARKRMVYENVNAVKVITLLRSTLVKESLDSSLSRKKIRKHLPVDEYN